MGAILFGVPSGRSLIKTAGRLTRQTHLTWGGVQIILRGPPAQRE